MSDRIGRVIELALGTTRPTDEVAFGLNLTLELRHPSSMPLLLLAIRALQKKTDAALRELNFVHYARFLPTRGNTALLVITEFDGELEPYVMDFAASISEVFTAILRFVKDAPPLPVHEHPQAFWAFIQKNNRVFGGCIDPWPLYTSYPDKTVLDIVGPRTLLPPPYVDAAAVAIDFADVQGGILRGYHARVARHFALQITDAASAAGFLAAIVSGDATAAPQLTTGEQWTRKPDDLLNIGFTADGLLAIGVARDVLARFPAAFLQGPADEDRARANGDIDDSAPAGWVLGAPGDPVHLLVSLQAFDATHLEARSAQLRGLWPFSGLRELSAHDAAALPDDTVYFGYKDGIAQPRIAGVPEKHPLNDMQPRASVGEFLLGRDYRSVYGGPSIGGLPVDLAQNGTYAAVRLMKQDVGGFERVLVAQAQKHGMHPEAVAAKLMGRWRNGDPLSLVPTLPPSWPSPSVPPAEVNQFDYEPTPVNPTVFRDFHGTRCPVGAHVRRMNPRAAPVAGKPYSRRLLRRGMPYQVAGGDGLAVEQGLLGVFICADLERQFEFLLRAWANGDTAASGIRKTQDPIIGTQAMSGRFNCPLTGPHDAIDFAVPRLVQTRGSVYLFMPGIRAVRGLVESMRPSSAAPVPIASAPPLAMPIMPPLPIMPPPRAAAPSWFDPDRFDPKDPAFLADPYPVYALFRQYAPVHYIGRHHKSFWVFSHARVSEVCRRTEDFLKERPGKRGSRGLFFMDPPRHAEIRSMMNPLFDRAIASAAARSAEVADEAIGAIKAGGRDVEIVSAFAKRIPRDVFMSVFGVPQHRVADVDRWVDTILLHYDRTLPLLQRAVALPSAWRLGWYLRSLRSACPAHAGGLMCLMKAHAEPQGMTPSEVRKTGQNFALGGYLSTQFLIATGIYNLLRDGGAAMRMLQADPGLMPNAVAEMLRFDAPFQMADRFAARDTTLGGVRIAAGERVVVVYSAANRDESVFPNPDTFDITRAPDARSYGFGHGIHHCIGAPLVDIIVPIALERLIRELPGLALGTDRPTWLTDPYFRSYERLTLRY